MSTIYENFGYGLPEDFSEIAEMCNTTFVCGLDKKWHMKDFYKGDTGNECANKNTLKQICETYKSGKSSCIKEGEVTYCYENVKDIPTSVSSTGKITNVPGPGSESLICGFDSTVNTHVTVLAPSCEMCPYNLSAYDGQICKVKTKENTVEKIEEEPIKKPIKIQEGEESTVKQTIDKKNFSCRFTPTSYSKLQELPTSCSRDSDCLVNDRTILEKWVDSINVEMDTASFTVSDVINKQVPEGSDLRYACILGEGYCDTSFSSMKELKQYLKDKIVPKQFVKKMKKDYIYGANIVKELTVEKNACNENKCTDSKVTLKDYVHINPHEKNKIEIRKIYGENVSSLFVNDKKVGGGIDIKNLYYDEKRKGLDSNYSVVHCSEENTCKNYTDNIDTVIDLNKSTDLFKPKGNETVYKIIKGTDVFILDNEYTVTTDTKNSQKECSKLLCTMNSEGCPSEYCKRGLFNECVPSDAPVVVKEIR